MTTVSFSILAMAAVPYRPDYLRRKRLHGIEPADLRIQLLLYVGFRIRAIGLMQPIQQRERVRHHIGRFPVFQMVLVDCRRQFLEDRKRDRLLADGEADLGQLQPALEPSASGVLARASADQDFERLLLTAGRAPPWRVRSVGRGASRAFFAISGRFIHLAVASDGHAGGEAGSVRMNVLQPFLSLVIRAGVSSSKADVVRDRDTT